MDLSHAAAADWDLVAACREGAAKSDAPKTIAEDPAATGKTVPDEADLESGSKAAATNGSEPIVEHKELTWAQKAGKAAMHGMNVDIHHRLTHDDHLKAIHDRAEIFEPKVEYTFKYLQVLPLPLFPHSFHWVLHTHNG